MRGKREIRALVTIVTLLGVLLGALAWSAPRRDVPLPAPTAPPAQVVKTYVAAVNARDFDTANALNSQVKYARWAHSPTIERITIERVQPLLPGQPGYDDTSARGHKMAALVSTRLDFGDEDDQNEKYDFLLVRESTGQHWRILAMKTG